MDSIMYLRYNILFLKIGGQFSLDGSKTWYNFWKFFVYLFAVLFILSLAANICEKGAFALSSVALDYVYIGALMWGLLKALYYNTHEKQCREMILKVNGLFKYHTDTLLDETCAKKRVTIINVITFSWMSFTALLAIIVNILPLFSNNRILPLPLWIPYDWMVSPYFELTVVMHLLFVGSLFVILIPTEIYFAGVVLLTSEQFKLLGWEIRNLFYTTLIQRGIPREKVLLFKKLSSSNRHTNYGFPKKEMSLDQIYGIIDSKEFQDQMVANTNKLITFHQSLLAFCTEMENFFSQQLLIFVPLIVVNLITLNLSIMTIRDLTLCIPYFPVCVYMYLELFVFCFLGNFYKTEYEQLQTDLYGLPWYNCSKKYKTNMKLFLQKLSSPVTMRIGKFSNLNLDLFLWAMKTIISYCVVVYQLTQRG